MAPWDAVTGRWGVVVAIAVGLFLIRLSFIQLFELADEIPPSVERLLRLVPAAVLAARLLVDGALAPGSDRMLAGLVGLAVAWRTADILRTLVAGMAALWVLTFLV